VEQKVALDRRLFGEVHEQVAQSLDLLADFSAFVEDFATARKARGEIVALRTKVYGADDWRVRDARLDLEHVHLLAGLDAPSRRQLRQAQQQNAQVEQLLRQGQARQALPLAVQALETRRHLLGEKHPQYATSLNNLAGLYQAMGSYAK